MVNELLWGYSGGVLYQELRMMTGRLLIQYVVLTTNPTIDKINIKFFGGICPIVLEVGRISV